MQNLNVVVLSHYKILSLKVDMYLVLNQRFLDTLGSNRNLVILLDFHICQDEGNAGSNYRGRPPGPSVQQYDYCVSGKINRPGFTNF